MDNSTFTDLLNEDLASDFQSIVQYTQHSAVRVPQALDCPLRAQTQDHVIDLRDALG